jgi:hypothetical protein
MYLRMAKMGLPIGLPVLLPGPHQHLVHRDAAVSGDDVGDGISEVLRPQRLDRPLQLVKANL